MVHVSTTLQAQDPQGHTQIRQFLAIESQTSPDPIHPPSNITSRPDRYQLGVALKDLIKRKRPSVATFEAERARNIQKVLNSHLFKTGETFTSTEVAQVIRSNQQQGARLLTYMEREGLIELKRDRQGKIFCCGRKLNIIRQAWRKHTDEELGI